ncbi:MAG: SDR family NAD(P)-dependent oxidoreductase, partial [Gemmatimonadota bacterium]
MTETRPAPGSSGVAFVTGASSGLGRGMVARLAEEGWAVAVSARREGVLADVVAAIEEAGGRAAACPADVG